MLDPEKPWGDLSREDEVFLSPALFVETIGAGYEKHGVKTEGTVWQSDGGSEFIGSWRKQGEICFHKRDRCPGGRTFSDTQRVTYNADVEMVHNTIELEFFDIEVFRR